MTARFNDNVLPALRALTDLDVRVTGAAPGAAPTLVTDGDTCLNLERIVAVVYADAATSAGLTAEVIPWFWASVNEDPAGGAATSAWVRGTPILVPLDAAGDTGQVVGVVIPTAASRVFLQVVPSGAGVAWVRADVYEGHLRSEVQAVSGLDFDALKAAFFAVLFSGTPIPVDTELTINGATLNINNLFTASTDGLDTGATYAKLNASQQAEIDLMAVGGGAVDLGGEAEADSIPVVESIDGPVMTRLGSNGDAASLTGSEAAQLRSIGTAAESIDTKEGTTGAAAAVDGTRAAQLRSIGEAAESLDTKHGTTGAAAAVDGTRAAQLRSIGESAAAINTAAGTIGDAAAVAGSRQAQLRAIAESVASMDDIVGSNDAASANPGARVLARATALAPVAVDEGDDALLSTTLTRLLRIAGYVDATQAVRIEEIEPLWSKHEELIPADGAALAAGSTYDYYVDMDDFQRGIGWQWVPADGNNTLNIYATIRDDGTAAAAIAAGDWFTVTNSWFAGGAGFTTAQLLTRDTLAAVKYLHFEVVRAGGSGASTHSLMYKKVGG